MATEYVYKQVPEESNPFRTEIQLDNKILTTPFYGSSISSDIDSECLREVNLSQQLKHTQVVCYSIGEAENFKSIMQKGLLEFTGQKLDFRPFSDFVLTIDPMGEYLRHNNQSEVEKLLSIDDLPQTIIKILQAKKSMKLIRLKGLMRDEEDVAGVVEWYLKKAISYGSKTAIAPCLPIEGNNTLKFAATVNRLAVTIQEANEWQKASYYLIDFKSFKDRSILYTIIKPKYIYIQIEEWKLLL